MSDQDRPEINRTRAEVRRSWWPGWIWAIPLAAVLLVGWWALRTLASGGEDITITFDDAHGLKSSGASVVYRGLKVGKVSVVALSKDGDHIDVTAHIDDSATRFLRSGSQFWLRGANPRLSNLSSLGAVLSGPTIVMAPGPGEKATHFVGLARAPVISGAHGKPQLYRVSLAGAVGGLSEGEPVKLRGFTVGEVNDVGFRYDAKSGAIETPVTLALYPSLFHIDGAPASDGRPALAAAIGRLIGEGLCVRLERDPPLIGTPEVRLDFVPGKSGAAPSLADGLPQIPAAPGGGIESVVDRVDKVPIDQIAGNVLDATHRLDTLVSSQKIADAIVQLDAALAQIRNTVDTTGPKVTGLVEKLRATADQLDRAASAAEGTAKTAQQAAAAADTVLGGAPSQNGMPEAMREITGAARSVRELANYLDRHPEALIQGRSGE